jgi:hypothetical protein
MCTDEEYIRSITLANEEAQEYFDMLDDLEEQCDELEDPCEVMIDE